MAVIQQQLGVAGFFIVNCKGRSRGLAGRCACDYSVILGVYGNSTNLWKHLSNLLRWLAGDVSGPWVLGRDFNEIVASHEYMGKRFRPMSQMRDFGDALEECDLALIPYTGYKYT
ncbi:unnamed protein product [Prunus armeniaca]|uniref:Endonuclease/exonuclease/phosphatase domain-containing protein n=1 Tax=Prunus armeniaca TaxID=36596 RepID=A0A6J5UUG3_PRUAR|nr:unnamed protein product [Prunus armeniaca]